jgi:hypothetical protein
MKSRRVGTLTLGVSLICAGMLFAARQFVPHILTFYFVFKLWPGILILLGIEVLAAYATHKEERLVYDGWAVFIMILVMCLAAAMAGCQVLIEHGIAGGCITF